MLPLDQIARRYVRLEVALGERDPDSLDYAAVSPELRNSVRKAYPTLDQIRTEADFLDAQLKHDSAAHLFRDGVSQERAAFLRMQLVATATRVSMLQGHLLPFDQEAGLLFQTSRLQQQTASLQQSIQDRVAALLPPGRSSKDATLAARYAAYDRQFLIPPGRLEPVLRAAVLACRQRTLEHVHLPANESVTLTFVRNKPWSAFSRYQGNAHSIMEVNLDLPLTVDDALELACHETYPGHHVFNTLHEADLVQKHHQEEASVQPTFSPQSYLSEAAAAFAPRLVFSDAERASVERDVLFPLAGLPRMKAGQYVVTRNLVRTLAFVEPSIAQRYLDGTLEFVRAGEALENDALMQHPEATLLYLNEFRSYMLAYTDGERRVREWVDRRLPDGTRQPTRKRFRLSKQERWNRYQRLFTLSVPPYEPGHHEILPIGTIYPAMRRM